MGKKYYPNKDKNDNFLWIRLKPRTLNYLSPFGEGGDKQVGIESTAKEDSDELWFLAPNELQDNVTHTWEPMENIISRFQEKYSQVVSEAKLATEQHKVDTALIYQNSNRREFEITFTLATHKSPKDEVVEPVNFLKKLSSPKLKNIEEFDTRVGNPDIVRLDTVTGKGNIIPMMNIKNAAIIGVQPNYQGPFVLGYPSYCELSVTFKDLEPLQKGSFEDVDTKVTVEWADEQKEKVEDISQKGDRYNVDETKSEWADEQKEKVEDISQKGWGLGRIWY